MNRSIGLITLPATAALLVVTGCGEQGTASADPGGDPGPGQPGQVYQVTATVLETTGAAGTGPQLCHLVAESYPPQCTGPEIVGWDWAAVEAEAASGTTWGSYLLTGTWDGARFTLTEPARPAAGDPRPAEPDQPDFTSPCPEPDGGWRPVDPATTTQDALDAAFALAAEDPGYAGGWVDQPQPATNDPAKLVLNLRFTGDHQAREQAVREVWGGALCLTGAAHTEAELLDIQRRVHDELPDVVVSAAPDTIANVLSVRVFVATDELAQEMDRRYGKGTVVLDGWLQPVS